MYVHVYDSVLCASFNEENKYVRIIKFRGEKVKGRDCDDNIMMMKQHAQNAFKMVG